MKRFKQIILTAILAIGISSTAFAQSTPSSSITASADVQAALSVGPASSNGDLEFGQVYQGLDKSVDKSATEAGVFSIAGSPNTSVSLDLDLPASLSDGSSNTLPVAFASDDASWNATDFDPSSSSISKTLDSSGDGELRIGGTVQPAGNQTSGNYTGTITLTVTY